MELNLKEKMKFLSIVDIFKKCKKRDIKSLAKASSIRRYEPGEYLCKQGDKGVALFIIVEGKVKVIEEIDSEKKVEVAELGPGNVVGELSIIDGAERVASVVASEPTTCIVLTSWDFKAVLKSRPEIALDILPVIVARFRETTSLLRNYGQKIGEIE